MVIGCWLASLLVSRLVSQSHRALRAGVGRPRISRGESTGRGEVRGEGGEARLREVGGGPWKQHPAGWAAEGTSHFPTFPEVGQVPSSLASLVRGKQWMSKGWPCPSTESWANQIMSLKGSQRSLVLGVTWTKESHVIMKFHLQGEEPQHNHFVFY